MNRKQFLILVVALLVLGGAGFALFWQDIAAYRESGARIGGKLLPEFKVAEVAQVRLQDAKTQVTLVRKDDRWVVVSCAANSIAQRLFRAIGRDDMADDPGLATNPQRVKRLEECDSVIAKWIAGHTLEETLQRFRDFDVVAGPIYDVAQISADPHVKHRGTLVEVEDPALGSVRLQNVVPRFRRSPGRVRWPGKPGIGADTHTVLADLGYSSDDIKRLESAGIIKAASRSATERGDVLAVVTGRRPQ